MHIDKIGGTRRYFLEDSLCVVEFAFLQMSQTHLKSRSDVVRPQSEGLAQEGHGFFKLVFAAAQEATLKVGRKIVGVDLKLGLEFSPCRLNIAGLQERLSEAGGGHRKIRSQLDGFLGFV